MKKVIALYTLDIGKSEMVKPGESCNLDDDEADRVVKIGAAVFPVEVPVQTADTKDSKKDKKGE